MKIKKKKFLRILFSFLFLSLSISTTYSNNTSSIETTIGTGTIINSNLIKKTGENIYPTSILEEVKNTSTGENSVGDEVNLDVFEEVGSNTGSVESNKDSKENGTTSDEDLLGEININEGLLDIGDSTGGKKSSSVLKKRSELLKKIFEESEEERVRREKERKELIIEVNKQLVGEVSETLQKDIERLEKYIDENEKLKAKLLLDEREKEQHQIEIERLEKSTQRYKEELINLKRLNDEIIPQKNLEISFLKKENTLLIEKYASELQKKVDEKERNTNIKLIILFGGYFLFFIARLFLSYYKKKKKKDDKDHYVQSAYVYGVIGLCFFSLIMIFVFNPDLVVYLLFLGSALVLTGKDIIMSFLFSVRSTRDLKIGKYVSYKGKKGVISRIGVLSFSLHLLDDEGKPKLETYKISNKNLGSDTVIISSYNYLTYEVKVNNLEQYSLNYYQLITQIKEFFKKVQHTKYEIIDFYEDNQRGLLIKWKTTELEEKSLIKKKLIDLLFEYKYIESVIEVLEFSKLENLLQKYNRDEEIFKSSIIVKKDYYEVHLFYKEEQKDKYKSLVLELDELKEENKTS